MVPMLAKVFTAASTTGTPVSEKAPILKSWIPSKSYFLLIDVVPSPLSFQPSPLDLSIVPTRLARSLFLSSNVCNSVSEASSKTSLLGLFFFCSWFFLCFLNQSSKSFLVLSLSLSEISWGLSAELPLVFLFFFSLFKKSSAYWSTTSFASPTPRASAIGWRGSYPVTGGLFFFLLVLYKGL